MNEPRMYTAYQSGPNGQWTVWDHLKDEAVTTDAPETEAVQLAEQLEREYWRSERTGN